MALIRLIANGTEGNCHKCGQAIPPGSMKVKRPSLKPSGHTFTEGGKHYVWVHERCAPTKTGKHGTNAKRR